MNILADESVDSLLVYRLRHEGHQVLYVAEMEPGISDHVVLERSNSEKSILLTADKDFGELIFRQNRHTSGIILIRLAGLSAEQKASVVISVFRKHGIEFKQAFVVITPKAVRIRRLKA